MEYLARREENIQDTVFGYMASLGKGFVAMIPTRSNAATTEVPLLLVQNPTDSDVTARLHQLYVAPDALSNNQELVIRLYADPTVTTNGTVLSIHSTRAAKGVTSNMSAYSLPTVSAMGTKFAEFYATTNFSLNEDNMGCYIDEAHSLLISVQQSVSGINYTTNLCWCEINDPV